nr:MAG TPA: hypothetical protein [Caudoviricetes sp.]
MPCSFNFLSFYFIMFNFYYIIAKSVSIVNIIK